MRRRRAGAGRGYGRGRWLAALAAMIAAAGLLTQTAPGAARAASRPPATPAARPQGRIADPAALLSPGWRTSPDRAVAVAGDATGLHVLVADASRGYTWRTAATLTVRGIDTTQWIGQACVTGNGQRAVVVYAPRDITNQADALGDGALAAVVNLTSGKVTPVGAGVSIAYFDPGCGTGDQAVLSQGGTGAGASRAQAYSTRLMTLNAATGRVTSAVTVPEEVTSAVPYAGRIAAAAGAGVVSIDARGRVRTLARAPGTPLRLVPDAAGGLGFEVISGKRVQVRRLAAGRDTLVGSAPTGSAELSQVGGRVFITGPHASAISSLPAGWQALDVPATATVSTTGALAVIAATTPVGAKGVSGLVAAPDAAQPVDITARVMGTGKRAKFTAPPAKSAAFSVLPAALPGFLGAGEPSVTRTTARTVMGSRTVGLAPSAVDPATLTYDPDRACSIPRDDPKIQTYQPSTAQEEWAVDQAVHGHLTGTRGPNLYQSGLPAYTPQGMFPAPGLAGGGNVPAQVLLGIMSQESAEYQASDHAIIGQTGNFMPSSNWYGDSGNYTYVNWANADCGYGTAQVTTGMCLAQVSGCANPLPPNDQLAVAVDYQANVAAGLQILQQKWNELYNLGIKANGGDPEYIENWYFALWDYNSGLEPSASNPDSSGHWGLGWVNNPINPIYPADREQYLSGNYNYDVSHPAQWPYQEKVLGYAQYGLYRWDFVHQTSNLAFASGNWSGPVDLPPNDLFCSLDASTGNNCDPLDGPAHCQLTPSHCWWHAPVTWVSSCILTCGTEALQYPAGSPDPGFPGVPAGYPADCAAPPGGSAWTIIDDVPSSAPDAMGDCPHGPSIAGSMTWNFASSIQSGVTTYPSKIDFHQIGAGFDGHYWFTHTIPSASSDPTSIQPQAGNADLVITGTWTPPATMIGWTDIIVHIPNYGAWDPEVNYQITPGTGQAVQYRIVNQSQGANTWVKLGLFDLSAGAHVSLSNVTYKGLGDDVAWDAMAFAHVSAPVANYVAMGDSYSSAEGVQPYDPDSDNSDNACHRSANGAYPRMVKLPGDSQPIATLAAAGGNYGFKFLACSGAETTQVSWNAVDNPPTPYDSAGNTDWGQPQILYGEGPQDSAGYLTKDTTLVTLTIGGNDARFADVIQGCLLTKVDCIDPSYHLTRSSNGAVDPAPLISFEPEVINLLETHLEAVYNSIYLKAPNAKIIVLGYPPLFQANPTSSCSVGLGPLGKVLPPLNMNVGDQSQLNQWTAQLNQTIRFAVESTHSIGADIHYMDPTSAFSGHELCSSDPWVNGILFWTPSGSGQQLLGPGSFHLKLAGQEEYATLVNGCLAKTISC